MSDVVLMHGTTQSAAGFWRLSDALRRYGHRVLTVDVPCGLSAQLLFHDVEPAHLPRALATVTTTDLTALYAEVPQLAMERMAHQRLHVEPIQIPGGHNAHVAHPEPIAEAVDAATTVGGSLPPQASSRSRQA